MVVLPDESVTATWEADGDVARYVYQIIDAEENVFFDYSGDELVTNYEIAANAITPDVVYTLKVGAMPVNGQEEDIFWKTAQFKREAVIVGTITSLTIQIGEEEAGEDAVILPGDSFTASWNAEGDVESYFYRVLDSEDNVVDQGDAVEATTLDISAEHFSSGEVYTLEVGAMPVNGQEDDIFWGTAQFIRIDVIDGFVMLNGVVIDYLGTGTAIVIPSVDTTGNAITEIGESAFENCTTLESVQIPNGVTVIGKKAFKNCSNLASMTAYD